MMGKYMKEEKPKKKKIDFSDLIVCLNLRHNKSIKLHKLIKLFLFSFIFFF